MIEINHEIVKDDYWIVRAKDIVNLGNAFYDKGYTKDEYTQELFKFVNTYFTHKVLFKKKEKKKWV